MIVGEISIKERLVVEAHELPENIRGGETLNAQLDSLGQVWAIIHGVDSKHIHFLDAALMPGTGIRTPEHLRRRIRHFAEEQLKAGK